MTDFVEVSGARLEYLDIPGGEPGLLLLHEGLGSVSMWGRFPASLATATGQRVVAYSRQGFGRSSPRTSPFSPRFMHEEAHEVLPALRRSVGLDRPVLVGHSTGASMALLHAAHDPHGVAGVVAMAPLVSVEESNLASIRDARERYAGTDWRERLARHHDDVDGVFHAWNDIWLDARFRSWSILPELPAVRCPILAILGSKDPYSSPAQVRAIAEHATGGPGTEVLFVEDCGHSPHRESADTVIGAISGFIAGGASGAPFPRPSCGKGHFER